MIFSLSLLLMGWVSLRWANRLAGTLADGYWIAVAVLMLQVGAITGLASGMHRLTPTVWLLVQLLIAATTLVWTPGLGQPGVRGLAQNRKLWGSVLTRWAVGLSPWGWIVLCAICATLVTSLVLQVATPVLNFDDRMYHGSRVIYWIQHQTAFPFETHNLRQTAVPFGSELFFLWPVLLTKSELVGRLVFWGALPLASVGQYLLLRALKLGRTAALVGVLILISTPLVVSSALGLKPEIWSILTLLGVAYWAVALCGGGAGGERTRIFFLGVFAVLSANVRSFPFALLPSLLLIVWWAPAQLSLGARLKSLATGLLCATLLSGVLIPLVSNTALYHHPLGPGEVRRIVQADLTPRVVYTHAVRFAFLLLELPVVPVSAETRAQLSGAANQVIAAIGAGVPLAGEGHGPWPGLFSYALPQRSARFSLWGLLWIPMLFAAGLRLVRDVASTWPRVVLTAASAQALLVVPLLAAIVFGSRWMTHSDAPVRFLVGPFALMLPMGMAWIVPRLSTKVLAQVVIAMVVAYGVLPSLKNLFGEAARSVAMPVSNKLVNEPFEELVGPLLPPGSRILLVGDQGVRDYPLFLPERRYANAVIPWGTRPFDPDHMRRLMASQRPTHILVEDEGRVVFWWFPALDTREMVQWLTKEPGLKEVHLRTRRMRLFEVRGTLPMDETPFRTMAVPPGAPLIRVADALQTRVGLDPTLLETPWPVENPGGAEGGYLWMGQGYDEGIAFALWSRQEREVDIRFDVSPGPGLSTPGRNVMALHDGVPMGDEQAFQGASSLVRRARLHAGRNVISFFALDAATIRPLPNGDPRGLVVGLHEIRIEPAAGGATGSDAPALVEDLYARPDRGGGLAHSARLATGLIASRQQPDGYWLTSYTRGPDFELPTEEMNTFVTSTVIDVLGSDPAPAGLGASLARARTHLRHQIEDGGLVRYHGRPGSRAMAELGLCTITPDADDTALVWRIAPGDDAWRAGALEMLKQYRTDEGLYRTWLGPREAYQCIDPGADPNPTDVGIQMHVFLWLAQADPLAARQLCAALRRTIGQDRLWVYYRQAPLVPVLRQGALKAAGCDIPLPVSHTQTAVPGQALWLSAVQMMQGLQAGGDQAPTRTELSHLLRAMSRDGFSLVKTTPPMLYHNDLTAAVSRFYWSEDVGYAIWLRLYLEGLRRGYWGTADVDSDAKGPRMAQGTP